jgi:twitching motility protein PilT
MQTGQAKYGMQTFNQSLATLYFKKLITLQVALSRSSNPDELQEMISRGAGALHQGTAAASTARPSGASRAS